MPPKLKFADGEKVLCFHGPLIYEAKALKSQIMKDKQVKYFIHYAGWNKNWDEWVPENRVLKYNDANVQRQKEVSKQHANSASKNKKAATPKPKKAESTSSKDSDSRASTPSKDIVKEQTPTAAIISTTSATPTVTQPTTTVPSTATTSSITSSTSTTSTSVTSIRGRSGKALSSTPNNTTNDEPPAKTKRRLVQTSESDDRTTIATGPPICTVAPTIVSTKTSNKGPISIAMPDGLKTWLVDDQDAINRQQKLHEIPAKKTVKEIIDEYMHHKRVLKTINNVNKEAPLTDVPLGLVEYFDVMLGSQLLYKFERPQYAEILEEHPNTPMSQLYGSFHLLRLFVRLGTMLSFSTLGDANLKHILVLVNDFIKYLMTNSSTLFSMQQFVNVNSEYHRKAQ